jgi:acyl carrier protein
MSDAEQVVFRLVRELLQRKGSSAEPTAASDLFTDLELDSLEVAELSVALEEELGSDPYSQGELPTTIGDVVAFYPA